MSYAVIDARKIAYVMLCMAWFVLPSFSNVVHGWNVTHFQTKNGLLHDNIRAFADDDDGNVWMGTWGKGLLRYDGYHFENINYDSFGVGDAVRAMHRDRRGRIWVGTSTGLFLCDGDAWHFLDVGSANDNSVRCIYGHSNGSILVGTDEHAYQYDGDRERIEDVTNSRRIVLYREISQGQSTESIVECNENTTWFAVSNVGIVSLSEGRFETLRVPGFLADQIKTLFKDEDGTVYAGYANGIARYKNGEWNVQSHQVNNVKNIARLPDGNLYVCSPNGFYVWEDNAWISILLSPTSAMTSYYSATTLSDGSVWIGSKSGAYRLSQTTWHYHNLDEKDLNIFPASFSADLDWPPVGITENGDGLYWADNRWKVKSPGAYSDFVDSAWDGRQYYWILTRTELHQIDRASMSLKKTFVLPPVTGKMQLKCRSDGTLQLFNFDTVYRLEENGTWNLLFRLEDIPDQSAEMLCLEEHPQGGYWIGTASGFGHWKDGKMQWLDSALSGNNKFKIFTIVNDRRGTTWFGTAVSGLLSYSEEGWKTYDTENGLLRNSIRTVFKDSFETLWVGTYKNGLSSYRNDLWLHYTVQDGLYNSQIEAVGEYPAGTFWMVFLNGEVVSLRKDQVPPKTNPISHSQNLAPDSLGIASFQADDWMNHTPQDELMYSWRIWDITHQTAFQDWSRFRRQQTVGFGPMPPGRYRFEVRAMDMFRNIETTPVSGPILVQPYLFQKVEVVLPMFLLTITSLVAILFWLRKHMSLVETIDYLQTVQNRLIEAQRLARVGNFAWYREDRVMELSEEFCKIAGLESDTTTFTHDQFVGMVHEDDRPFYLHKLNLLIKHNRPLSHEFRLVSTTGVIRTVNMEATASPDENGQPTQISGTLQDITDYVESRREKEQLEEQFYQTQKIEAIGRLAGGMAHNLNNILTGVIGNLSLLAPKVPDDAMKYIEEANVSAERAALLVKELLHFSQKSFFQLELGSINQVVRKALPFIQDTFDRKIHIAVNTTETIPKIFMDATYLHTVLMNLCLNAQEAIQRVSPEKKFYHRRHDRFCIAIQTDVQELSTQRSPSLISSNKFAVLSVSDNGIGIAQEDKPHIFEPFFTTNKHGSAGMGLASALGIIEKHNGWIDFCSEYGSGSSFYIYIPIPSETNDA